MIKTEVFILPDYFANYLINGDAEGLKDNELYSIDNFMIINNLYSCIDFDNESYFCISNDLNNIGSNCMKFTFTAY